MANEMNWVHDPHMDILKAETENGAYHCVRNYADMSVLWLDGTRLGVFGGGSHENAKQFAEIHLAMSAKSEISNEAAEMSANA